jgi:hypothetical protein
MLANQSGSDKGTVQVTAITIPLYMTAYFVAGGITL